MHYIYKCLIIAWNFFKLAALLVYFFFVTYWICFIEESRAPISFEYEYQSFWITSYALEGVLAADAFIVIYQYFKSVCDRSDNQVAPSSCSEIKNAVRSAQNKAQVGGFSFLFYVIITLLNIPISPIAYAVGYTHYANLRALRLVSFIFINKYWNDAFSLVIKSIPINRVMKSFVAMAVFGHAAACGYYALGIYELNKGDTKAWLVQGDYPLASSTGGGEINFNYPVQQRYLRSIYWAIQTIETVGFGDIVAYTIEETWFCIIFFYISVGLVAVTIGTAANMATALDAQRMAVHGKINRLHKYALYRKLPVYLIDRIRSFYDYQQHVSVVDGQKSIVDTLPDNLQVKLKVALVRDLLKHVSELRCLRNIVLNAIVGESFSYTYSPKDIISANNSTVKGLYVVSDGTAILEDMSGNGLNFVLQRGDSYGSKSLLSKKYTSVGQLKAFSYCEIYFISASRFRRVCQLHMTPQELEECNLIAVPGEAASNSKNFGSVKKAESVKKNRSALRGAAPVSPRKFKAKSPQAQRNKISSPKTKNKEEFFSEHVGLVTPNRPSSPFDSTPAPLNLTSPREMSGLGDSTSNIQSIDSPVETEDDFSTPVARSRRMAATLIKRHSSVIRDTSDKSSGCNGIFLPGHMFRNVWVVLEIGCIVFYCVSCGLLLSRVYSKNADNEQHKYYRWAVIDALMIINFVLNAAVFSYNDDGDIITSPTRLFSRFKDRHNLWLEILCILPLDFAALLIGEYQAFVFLRLLKLIHIGKLVDLLDSVLEMFQVVGIVFSTPVMRFFEHMILLYMVIHYTACLWMFTADLSTNVYGYETNWQLVDEENETMYIRHSAFDGQATYWRAMYWAFCVLLTAGTLTQTLPRNDVETIVCIVIMFFGCMFLNAFVGSIASLLGQFNAEKRKYFKKVHELQDIMVETPIPQEVKDKIYQYYGYMWENYGGVSERDVLADLPEHLVNSVVNHVIGDMIKKIPFFSILDNRILHLIVGLFVGRVFLHGDTVLTCGEVGKDMFVIERGTVEVTSADRKVVFVRLQSGSYIGESCLLKSSVRTASAFALGYCETYVLTKDAFMQVSEYFPEEYERIVNELKRVLAEKQLENDNKIKAKNERIERHSLSIHHHGTHHHHHHRHSTHHHHHRHSTHHHHRQTEVQPQGALGGILKSVKTALTYPLQIGSATKPSYSGDGVDEGVRSKSEIASALAGIKLSSQLPSLTGGVHRKVKSASDGIGKNSPPSSSIDPCGEVALMASSEMSITQSGATTSVDVYHGDSENRTTTADDLAISDFHANDSTESFENLSELSDICEAATISEGDNRSPLSFSSVSRVTPLNTLHEGSEDSGSDDEEFSSGSSSSSSSSSSSDEGEADELIKKVLAEAEAKKKESEGILRLLHTFVLSLILPLFTPFVWVFDRFILNLVFSEELSKALFENSNRRKAWDCFILGIVMYNILLIPISLAIGTSDLWYVTDYVLDSFLFLDALAHWTLFSVSHQGDIVSTARGIRDLYNEDRLLIDLLRITPWDLVVLIPFPGSSEYRAFARVPKLFLVVGFMDYFRQFQSLLEDFKVHYLASQLLVVVVGIFVVAHWSACGLYWLSTVHADDKCIPDPEKFWLYGDACEYRGTWVQYQIMSEKLGADGGTSFQRYLRALNYSFPSLLLILLADAIPINANEIFYLFWVMFATVAVSSFIIGTIISVSINLDDGSATIVSKRDELYAYLLRSGVSESLMGRANDYLANMLSEYGMVFRKHERAFAKGELPHSLYTAINVALKVKFIRDCPVFDFFDDDATVELSSKLVYACFGAGDNIVSEGELGTDMYFIENGSCAVVGSDGTVYATLTRGGFFGETALFFKQPRTATICACEHNTVLYSLSKESLDAQLRRMDIDLEWILKSFIEVQEANARIRTNITKNLEIAATPGTKLSKLIVLNEETVEGKQSWGNFLRRVVFAPNSLGRLLWVSLELILLFYYLIFVPYELAFLFEEHGTRYFYTITFIDDLLVDAFFIIDIIAKMYFIPFIDKKGDVFYEPEKIFEYYKSHGYFFYDALASIPWELVVVIPGVSMHSLFSVRLVHLIRVFQVPVCIQEIQNIVGSMYKFRIKNGLQLLCRTIFVWLVASHWGACTLFMVPRYLAHYDSVTWTTKDGIAEYDEAIGVNDICSEPLMTCYSRSLYSVAATFSNVAYGDIAPYADIEIVAHLIMCLCAAYLCAVLVGSFSAYFKETESSGTSSYIEKLQQVRLFARSKHLDTSLKRQIKSHFDYIWEKEKRVDNLKSSLLYELSSPIVLDISYEILLPLVQSIPCINLLTPTILQKRIAAALSPQMRARGDVIFELGDPGSSIYFVSSGEIRMDMPSEADRVSVDTFGKDMLTVLKEKHAACGDIYSRGDHFGEYCVLSKGELRVQTVVTLSQYAEIFTLDREALWKALLYLQLRERREFLLRLFTTCGECSFANCLKGDLLHGSGDAGSDDDDDEIPVPSVRVTRTLRSRRSVGAGMWQKKLTAAVVAASTQTNGAKAPEVVESIDPVDKRIKILFKLASEVLRVVVKKILESEIENAVSGNTAPKYAVSPMRLFTLRKEEFAEESPEEKVESPMDATYQIEKTFSLRWSNKVGVSSTPSSPHLLEANKSFMSPVLGSMTSDATPTVQTPVPGQEGVNTPIPDIDTVEGALSPVSPTKPRESVNMGTRLLTENRIVKISSVGQQGCLNEEMRDAEPV